MNQFKLVITAMSSTGSYTRHKYLEYVQDEASFVLIGTQVRAYAVPDKRLIVEIL